MTKFCKLAGAATLAALTTMGAARAEDRQFEWSMTVGGTSDYIFRGLSLHGEDPAAQGSIDMGYGIFYAGAWASNVGTKSDGLFAPMELDLYAGIKPTLGQFEFDFAIIGYLYPIADNPGNYIEFKAAVSTEIVKSLTGGLTFYYTPDQDNYPTTWTIEGKLAYELPEMHRFTPTISGTLGYSDDPDETGVFSDVKFDYVYWNVGLALAIEKFTFDFRYWDTNIGNNPGDFQFGLADERFVFTATATLP